LIRDAIFRSRQIPPDEQRLSLSIGSLAELLDMYHAYKATRLHDKVYALLGMCSDNLETAGLEPNYDIGWKLLVHRLTRFILGDQVSVDTWEDKEIALIESKGYILGQVSWAKSNTKSSGQILQATFKGKFECHDWTLPNSAVSIQTGDYICLLQGASKPTIARLCDNYFMIIMIAAAPPQKIQAGDCVVEEVNWLKLLQSVSLLYDFSLVWDWGFQGKVQGRGGYDELINTRPLEWSMSKLEIQLRNAMRIRNVARMLQDLGERSQVGETPPKALHWLAANGHEAAPKILHKVGRVDGDLKHDSGRTLLSWATQNGDMGIVKLLFAINGVDVNSKDKSGRTPFSWAAQNGDEGIVKLLLTMDAVDVNSKDNSGRTPVSWAIESGDEGIFKLLLETGQLDVNSRDSQGRSPLWFAVRYRHKGLIKQLHSIGCTL
jgi:hypothetical protein